MVTCSTIYQTLKMFHSVVNYAYGKDPGHEFRYPQRPEEVDLSRAGVTGGCELTDMDAGS